jgi:hypothetical protein
MMMRSSQSVSVVTVRARSKTTQEYHTAPRYFPSPVCTITSVLGSRRSLECQCSFLTGAYGQPRMYSYLVCTCSPTRRDITETPNQSQQSCLGFSTRVTSQHHKHSNSWHKQNLLQFPSRRAQPPNSPPIHVVVNTLAFAASRCQLLAAFLQLVCKNINLGLPEYLTTGNIKGLSEEVSAAVFDALRNEHPKIVFNVEAGESTLLDELKEQVGDLRGPEQ